MSFLPPLNLAGRDRVRLSALPGPAAALALAELAAVSERPLVAICSGEQQAHRLEAELGFFLGGSPLPVLHLPDTEVLPYESQSPHQEILSTRLAALHRLPRLTRGVLIVTADALIQRLPPKAWLEGRTLLLKKGEALEMEAFRGRLLAAGYQPVSEVQMQGEFAVRGSILDLFPMGSEQAFRLDLFDRELESIRVFDPETQRSEGQVEEIRLLPARDFPTDKAGIELFRRHYREYFPGDPARSRIYREVSKGLMPGGIEFYLPLFFEQTARLDDYLPQSRLWVEMADIPRALAEDWKQTGDRYDRYAGDLERPLLKPDDLYWTPSLPDLAAEILPAGLEMLAGSGEAMRSRVKDAGGRILFVAESAGRREALLAWLKPLGINTRDYASFSEFSGDRSRYGMLIGPLQDSLALPEGTLLVSEMQVFGLSAPVRQRRRAGARDAATLLRDLNDLHDGSPVVHVQHGVGRYRGLTTMDGGGTPAEYLVLEYEGGDRIYVPVASLGLIHRYVGTDAEHAPLHALGSERWEKARARARSRAHDVAAELLQTQARRVARPGHRLEVNSADYEKFCADFPFTPTPDQQKAIDEVLAGMAADRPMDRVICGDVGFGKTEVALRATFAAVRNGRQVCVLAPTTLLVQQHYKNFCDRFAGWPVRIGALSRLRGAAEQNQWIKDMADGKLDVVIGTHRLLQDDIRFKDLGLVVIDEEHRFGVRHKEKLKALRASVDILTLTATPIPRTLNLTLAGLREMSIIATPPEGRLPIRTSVAEWDRGLVYEACLRELRRGGQIYYLHNEVDNIARVAQDLQKLVPEAQVRFAHGQMRERELEQVMLDFYHQRFNLLVCTTIIESGIDVPSANTILINRADTLGLAQLHQLRGRVGRSHHRAYAYLLVPSREALKPDAEKRLDAIEAMGELGAGFLLATQDLEIRGAGELLGEEQSGQIEEIGFTLYAEMLAESVASLKAGDLDDLPLGAAACEVDMGVSALLPDVYIPDVHVRLVLYKRLAEAASPEALDDLQSEMVDRFGPLPEPAQRLVEAMRLRIAGQALGLSKLRAGARSVVLEFGPRPKLDPSRLIQLIQKQPKAYRMEGQHKLHHAVAAETAAARHAAALALLDTLAGRKP